MKICSVVGTRPNFIKEYLVNQELRRRGIREVLIHTGQHHDYEMSQAFFECFELPAPDYHLHIANTNGVDFSAQTILELAPVFRAEKPDCVLSYGDVNSTLSAAIAASKLGIPFAHVEGGIRAVDRLNPEEINRRVSDVLADVIFCCTKTDVNNLHKEGYNPERIEFTGDLMKDALLMTLKKYGIKVCRWSATPCDIFRTNSSRAANHLSRPPKDLAKHEGFRSPGDASRFANRTLQTDGVRGFSPIDCGGRQDSHGFRGSAPGGVPSEETLCRTDRTLVVSGDFASWMEGLDWT